MGFFDLFRRKPHIDTERLVVNLTENGLDVNGVRIILPCNIDALKHIFGHARETVHPAMFGREKTYNYTWDKLGIYCYSSGGSVVHNISVRMNGEADLSYSPASLFQGIYTINGENWFDVMKNGETQWLEDEGIRVPIFKQTTLGKYSVISEFTNEDTSDGTTESSSDLKNIEVEIH